MKIRAFFGVNPRFTKGWSGRGVMEILAHVDDVLTYNFEISKKEFEEGKTVNSILSDIALKKGERMKATVVCMAWREVQE
jgi:hypothetical protein